ncbi:O-antigen ligase family protein [Dactylosporangium sp. CA-152071]|uniref:O-antigen ligase family protein n=1 Tax=Dactylosporangium sp. CA-152071 TaxID=3239933 RepID=UPI003D93B8A6
MTSGGLRVSTWSAGWVVEGVAAGALVAYIALRQPLLALGLGLALAVAVAAMRPGMIVPSLVPLSTATTAYPLAHIGVYVGAAILIVTVVRRAFAARDARVRLGWPPVCLTLLAAALVVSARGDGPPGRDSDLSGLLIGLLLAAVIGFLPPRPLTVARVVTVTGAVAAVLATVDGVYVSGRMSGAGLLANYFGALLAICVATGVGLARAERRVAWLIPVACCLAAIVQTHSRGAVVATAVGIVVALLAGRPARWQIAGAALAGVAGFATVRVANPLADAVVGSRSATQLTINSEVRLQAARLAVDIAQDHPLLGIGYATFPRIAAADPRLGIYMNTHNDFLRLAAESGAAALVLFLAVLAAALCWRAGAGFLPLRAAVAAGAANLFFANTLSNLTASGLFWVCLGVLLAGRGSDRRADIEETTTDARLHH